MIHRLADLTSTDQIREHPSNPSNPWSIPLRSFILDSVYFGSQRRNNVEEIAHDSIIRDVEDRHLAVLVDGDNRLRVLHPDDMLNRSRDTNGQVQFRRDCLPRAADLPIHRQPLVVANWTRGGNLRTHCLGELLNHLDVFLALYSAADRND